MADTYTMKIPRELADFFQEYIDKNRRLGFRTVSQYILYALQNHAKDLMETEEEKRQKRITLQSGTYTKEELLKLLADSEKEKLKQ